MPITPNLPLTPKRLPQNVRDYELWFCCGHKKTPRPLQGHEIPQVILLKNIENNFKQRERNIKAFPSLPGVYGNHDNLEDYGRFVLKIRDPAKNQEQSNVEEKKLKKRWPHMSSLFHKGSVPQPDKLVEKQGKLFRNSLVAICNDGNLPYAVLDMLSVMKNKGPNTEGIFMLPANVTSGQILKEKLDHGQYVNLYMEDVHVVAAVLKEFLQNLENSLMTAELYEEWLSVLDCLTEQEQLAAAKSLLEKVPPVNALLIIHLFRILHTISKNSEKNMMCSDRLALCLAPILLWRPGSGFGEKFSRKVSLVSFLIKNSPYIFGENIVFYEASFFNSYGNKSSSVLQKEIEQENRSHSGMTCPTESDTVPGSTRASIENKEILDSVTSEGRTPTSRPETKEESLNITPPEEDTTVFSPSPPGPFVSPPGHLFGRSLKSICNNGNLPAVILEMISIIHEKGLDEYRLFRYLGTKAFWDLRERIDTQQAVNLNQESVNVIGAVLKDFIGKLQGSLLCCELYEDWLNVLDEGDLDQKISTIQRLLLKMPRPNLILLRHLMHLLHEIKSHSSIWFVNAHILSFRIADSLLWKDTADYSISETDFSKRVSLIKLLIDYFPKIFKEDTSKLYKDVQRSVEDIKNSSGDKSPDKADADNQMDIGTTFFSSTIDHPVEDDN